MMIVPELRGGKCSSARRFMHQSLSIPMRRISEFTMESPRLIRGYVVQLNEVYRETVWLEINLQSNRPTR